MLALNMTTGETLKQVGQARAQKRAGSEWLATALDKFKEFCTIAYSVGSTAVTIDEFRAEGGMPEPHSHNAWGALPRAAVKAGVIQPTAHTEKAQRPSAHARTVRVWRINPEAL